MEMTLDTAKIINVLSGEYGKFEEKELRAPRAQITESMLPYPRNRRGNITINHEEVDLQEAGAQLSTANFPDALRQGLQTDLFTSYNETPVTYPAFVRQITSTKQQEEYLFDSAVGLPPIVAEGENYPEVATDFDSGLIIRNHKRGYILSVTEEMQRFDQVGKVREMAELMGRAHRRGEEQSVMDVITTTANYTRTNTAGDNDESATGSGANQQTLTFSPTGLIAAFNILRTMKDRRTGLYLGVMPTTLIVAPKLAWAVKQLIQSPTIMRTGASEVYGNGINNAFFDLVTQIIVSPEFGSNYEWALMEPGRAVTFQRVDPITLLIEGQGTQTEGYFNRDVIRYRARNWYGVGMRDDRFAFFSNSTTAPAIN
jgi:hypothetical protein